VVVITNIRMSGIGWITGVGVNARRRDAVNRSMGLLSAVFVPVEESGLFHVPADLVTDTQDAGLGAPLSIWAVS
jgi:hypothetical protein